MIEYVCSADTDVHIPWDVWGAGTVEMEIPSSEYSFPAEVHGTHVVTIGMGYRNDLVDYHCVVSIFDFGPRGCSASQFWGGKGSGGEGKASFEDRREFKLEREKKEGTSYWYPLRPVGNGNLISHVSLTDNSRSRIIFRTWELT